LSEVLFGILFFRGLLADDAVGPADNQEKGAEDGSH